MKDIQLDEENGISDPENKLSIVKNRSHRGGSTDNKLHKNRSES